MAHTFTLPSQQPPDPSWGRSSGLPPGRSSDPSSTPPGEVDIADFTFHGARDVVAFAERGGVCIGRPRCASWHLDDTGRFVCGTRGFFDDTLAGWVANPSRLLAAASDGVAGQPCGTRWVVIDERTAARSGDVIDEGDVRHFLELRCALARVGVDLLDAVVFDDRGRWWSICELLTGSTRWGEHRLPCIDGDESWRLAS
jgi:hypothetical protein